MSTVQNARVSQPILDTIALGRISWNNGGTGERVDAVDVERRKTSIEDGKRGAGRTVQPTEALTQRASRPKENH